MTIEYTSVAPHEKPENNIVGIKVSEKLEAKDYEKFVAEVERLLQHNENVNLFIELENFEGWTAGALWEDTKFALKHFNDVERMAIVGGRDFEKNMASFVKPFAKTEIKFFEPTEITSARSWIRN